MEIETDIEHSVTLHQTSNLNKKINQMENYCRLSPWSCVSAFNFFVKLYIFVATACVASSNSCLASSLVARAI
jgi:hypothetical protein